MLELLQSKLFPISSDQPAVAALQLFVALVTFGVLPNQHAASFVWLMRYGGWSKI